MMPLNLIAYILFSEHISAGCHKCPVLVVHAILIDVLHAPIVADTQLYVAHNLHTGTETQSPVKAFLHLVTEHIVCPCVGRCFPVIRGDCFLRLTEQSDIEIRSGIDKQTDISSRSEFVTNMDRDAQVVRGTFPVGSISGRRRARSCPSRTGRAIVIVTGGLPTVR